MRRQQASVNGATGQTVPLVLDNNVSPFHVGLAVIVAAGSTLTYTVEHTFDDVFAAGFNPATANWIAHSTLAAQSATKDSNYAFPVMAIRLNVTSWTAGGATLQVLQAGH